MFNRLKSIITPASPIITALKEADRSTPDEIIAAAVMQSMAQNFDDWTKEGGKGRVVANCAPYSEYSILTNSKKSIKVGFYYRGWLKGKSRDSDGHPPYYWHSIRGRETGFVVNGVKLSEGVGRRIVAAYERLADQHKKTHEAAARAKAEMERNEAAWNLAENLLGMKRNEHGALVPVKTTEEVE